MLTRLSTLVLCLLVSFGAAAADVGQLAKLYEHPTLGAAKTISNASVKIGSLSLTLSSGTIAPVQAGDETIGAFFSGTGTYSYKSTDPVERSLVQFEAKKVDRAAVVTNDGVLTITGPLDRVFIRAGGIALPTGTTDAPALTAAFQKHRDDFGNVLWQPPSHLLLRQRFDAPSSQVAVVEIGSGRESQGYILDTIEEKEESFFALITRNGLYNMADLRGALFPIKISEQPVGRTRSAFLQPRYLLVNLDYTLTAADDDAKLSTVETIVPRGVPQSVFRFNLMKGKRDSAGRIRAVRVDAVTDEKGKPLPFDFNYGSLLVSLPAKAAADQPLVMKFQISGDYLLRPNNGSFWQLGTEPWFPQPELNGQYYTVHSIVKIKKPWVAFASGNTVKRSEEGDYNVFENAFDKPLQFAVVHGGKYTVHEQKFDDLTIKVAPYAGINDTQVKQLANLAHTIIKFYEPWLGPFPFKEFSIIEINELGWGQAPPGMMFITQEAFNPMSNAETRAYSKGVNQRFAHEIAHQYWGIAVKMSSEEDQWFTEAFSELSSAMVVNQIEGKRGYDNLVNSWKAEGRDGGNFAPIVLANRISTPADPVVGLQHYINLVYGKGAYVLAALRKEVGDTKFFSWMRTLQGQFAWKFMTTENAAMLLSRMDNGKDHVAYFNKYVFGTETPTWPK